MNEVRPINTANPLMAGAAVSQVPKAQNSQAGSQTPTSANNTVAGTARPAPEPILSEQRIQAGDKSKTEKGSPLFQQDNALQGADNDSRTDDQQQDRLRDAVADMNQYVQNVNRDLHFSLDKESGKTVIRVVEQGTGELIRQIPEEIFLQLARNLKEDEPVHLVNAQG